MVAGADALKEVASKNDYRLRLASIPKVIPAGVSGVGEFVEISVEPRRSDSFFKDEVLG